MACMCLLFPQKTCLLQAKEATASLDTAQAASQAALAVIQQQLDTQTTSASDAASVSKAEISSLQQQLQDISTASEAAQSSLQQRLQDVTAANETARGTLQQQLEEREKHAEELAGDLLCLLMKYIMVDSGPVRSLCCFALRLAAKVLRLVCPVADVLLLVIGLLV